MKKVLNIVFAAVIVLSLVLIACSYMGLFREPVDPGLTVVAAPEQTKAERPPCFPDPEENYIKLPETVNLAEGKPTQSGEFTDVYVGTNINDGKTDTYWESKGWPAEVVVDLQGTYHVATAAVRLNPSAIWEPRQQEIAIAVSTDGVNFTEVVGPAMYQFDPETGNRIRIDFTAVDAAYVKFVFTKSTASRTGGAQAAEIEVYE